MCRLPPERSQNLCENSGFLLFFSGFLDFSHRLSVVPAGSQVLWRWSGHFDWLHVFLEPWLIGRVAAEAFGLDPARVTIPSLDGLDLPPLRAAMGAVDAELDAGGAGGRLAAESLANVLAVHLLRHVLAPRRPERGSDGPLPESSPWCRPGARTGCARVGTRTSCTST